MKLYPYRDAHGQLYPELDWRWVSGDVLAQYLSVSVSTVWNQTRAGLFGATSDPASGVRLLRTPTSKRSRIQYRPGVLWQRKRLGRYGDPRFDWQSLSGRIVLYHAPLSEAAAPAAPATVDPTDRDLLKNVGSAVLRLIQESVTQQTITFSGPRLVEEG